MKINQTPNEKESLCLAKLQIKRGSDVNRTPNKVKILYLPCKAQIKRVSHDNQTRNKRELFVKSKPNANNYPFCQNKNFGSLQMFSVCTYFTIKHTKDGPCQYKTYGKGEPYDNQNSFCQNKNFGLHKCFQFADVSP